MFIQYTLRSPYTKIKDMIIHPMITSSINVSTEKKSESEARDVVKKDGPVCHNDEDQYQ